MPWSAPQPCAVRGCREVVQSGARCPAHTRQHLKAKWDELDAERGSSHSRGYDHNWRKIRRIVIGLNPVCPCGQPTEDVDHIIPMARGGTSDFSNLQALCHACHSRKTVREDGGFGRRRSRGDTP